MFYRVPRMGAIELSCGGGPFGFDITVAVRVDYLITHYKCDALIESGTHMGDTTDYLSSVYPNLPVWSCDVESRYVRFAQHRLRHRANVKITLGQSPELIRKASEQFAFPFYYLDAHWYDYWPLVDEIDAIRRGVVCIDDFDVGDERFSHDTYGGVACNVELLPEYLRETCYKANAMTDVGFPCLQNGRRGGKCYYVLPAADLFSECDLFEPIRKH